MAFKDCVERITRAAGRSMTDAEIMSVAMALNKEVRKLSRKQGFDDPAGNPPDLKALPPGLIRDAAKEAATALLYEAQMKRQRVALQIMKHEELRPLIEGAATAERGVDAVLQAVDHNIHAIKNTYYGRLVDTLNATSPRWFGLMEDAKGIRDLVREIFGEHTGNPSAKAGAKSWHEVSDAMRLRFNRSGGDIRKLLTYGIHQTHDMRLVRGDNTPQAMNRWVDYVMQRIDKRRYQREDGTLQTDGEIRGILEPSWKSISTNGASDIEPGKTAGEAARAKRNAEHRVIHFKNADAWLEYHKEYSGHGIYATVVNHVDRLSRDIGLIETLGPNPAHEFGYWRDVAKKAETSGLRISRLEALYRQIDGSANTIVDMRIAAAAGAVRSLKSASALGFSTISSLTDFATAPLTAFHNRIPMFRYLGNVLEAMNPLDHSDVRRAQNASLGLETLVSSVNRFGEDSLGGHWATRIGSASMRAFGITGLTEAHRRAYTVAHAATLGDLTEKAWGDLHPQDQSQLTHYGITETDWKLLQKVEGEYFTERNPRVLTTDSIYKLTDEQLGETGAAAARSRDRLATKALAMVLGEMDFAIVTPDAKTRSLMFGISGPRGDLGGEFARMAWLFKSFPMAAVQKHWYRGFGMKTVGGKAAYLAAYFVGTTIIGAANKQIRDFLKGLTPSDMTTAAFWTQAVLTGGGLGLIGDFVLNDASRFGRSFIESVMGPIIGGTGGDLYDLTMGNIHEAGRGEPTHLAAETVKFARDNTPFINAWYARALMDYLIFNEVQEYISPGYLAKVRARKFKDTGQRTWNK